MSLTAKTTASRFLRIDADQPAAPDATHSDDQSGSVRILARAAAGWTWRASPRLPTCVRTCLVLCLALASIAPAQLSGTYTIDPSGSGPRNYTSFGAAIGALGTGVSGPVKFDVASTTFKETLVIGAVNGTSNVNTVTFRASAAPAVIDANGQRIAVLFSPGAEWYRLENLRVIGWEWRGMVVEQQARYCEFRAVTVEMPTNEKSDSCALGCEGSDNTFRNCNFRNGKRWVVIVNYGGRNVFDSCEMDGRGVAQWVLRLSNIRDGGDVIQNCLIVGAGPAAGVGVGLWPRSVLANNAIICNTSNVAVEAIMPSGWDSACSFKNNVVVNLGTGAAIRFGFWTSSTQLVDELNCCVSDHNCYYCRNTFGTIMVQRIVPSPSTVFSGSLAAFLAWQKQNPNVIQAGGATSYDANSIESDPGLVSMTTPYDIHLRFTSPLIDRGTSKLVESYQTLPQNLAVTHDVDGEVRGWQPDIGADEIAASLVGSGSTSIGGTQNLVLSAPRDSGLSYQVGSSFGTGPIMIGWRPLGLGVDDLLVVTASNYWPTVFSGYRGILDGQGQAKAAVNIPKIPGLIGQTIHSAFVTISPSVPFGIQSISSTFSFAITK